MVEEAEVDSAAQQVLVDLAVEQRRQSGRLPQINQHSCSMRICFGRHSLEYLEPS